MAKQDAPVDPEVQKWLEENAISTGKADINLVVTEGQEETTTTSRILPGDTTEMVFWGNATRTSPDKSWYQYFLALAQIDLQFHSVGSGARENAN